MTDHIPTPKEKLLHCLDKTSDAAQDYLEIMKGDKDELSFVKLLGLIQTLKQIRQELAN